MSSLPHPPEPDYGCEWQDLFLKAVLKELCPGIPGKVDKSGVHMTMEKTPGRRLIWDAIGNAVLACPSHHMPRQSLFTLYFPRSEIVSQTLTHFPPKGEQVHSGLLCLWLLFIPLACGFYFYNIVNIKRGALQKRWPRVVPTLFYFQRIAPLSLWLNISKLAFLWSHDHQDSVTVAYLFCWYLYISYPPDISPQIPSISIYCHCFI